MSCHLSQSQFKLASAACTELHSLQSLIVSSVVCHNQYLSPPAAAFAKMEIACREKRKNGDRVMHPHIVCHDQDSSPGESCAAHYFKISIELRNDFRGEIFTFYKVGYLEKSDMRSSAVLKKCIHKRYINLTKLSAKTKAAADM